ncbi:unnamed protein product [Clavelina lepadiformis]|uniref:General transcription factor IIH subunit 3 n=1 Tax=Clavelina lepadiformis TaxID=159417 RepID=A0ABP0GPX9_CLALP
MDPGEQQVLVVIFDVSPVWWGLKSLQGQAHITKFFDSLIIFMNSYLMLHSDNKLAVIASHSTKSIFLYPPPQAGNEQNSSEYGDCRDKHFAVVDNAIISSFKTLMSDGCEEKDMRSDSLIAGSMANALCYIHRITQELESRERASSRILVVKAADDAASQYMSFMNVIFAAQKEHVVVDSCVLGQDSGLLQQACDMTGGLYLKVPSQYAFLQYLLTAFLTEPELRKDSLVLSRTKSLHSVDYRAACFCHRCLVEVGFVCSVCLSIFCQFSPICSTCETVFRPSSLVLKSRKKRKVPSRSSSPCTDASIK